MEEVIKTIVDALIPVLITVIGGLLTWLGTKIKSYFDEKRKDETVDKILGSTVKYIEQVYKDIHGEEKLKKAKEIASGWLKSKKIKISDEELNILIESFVNGLKK